MKVLVLMSTYNGEKFLREQLDSLYSQTVPVDILVRDDGSSDGTTEILSEQKQQGKLDWYTGENLRPAKSFWHLLRNAPAADYYCFCDQDDVWFNNKVEHAIRKLEEQVNKNRSLLYCSNVTVADMDLEPLYNMNKGDCNTDFAHSLIYSLAPGCTMVFNHAAREELIKYDMDTEYVIIHDWLAHKIVAMLGTVIYDAEPSMLYRQHGNNVIGAKHGFFSKVARFLKSKDCVRSNSARALLNVYDDQIDEESRNFLKMVGYYRTDKKLRKQLKKTVKCRLKKSQRFIVQCLIALNKI